MFKRPDFSVFSVYGETAYVESLVSTDTTFGTSNSFFDLTSIPLTAGEWDITLIVGTKNNGVITETLYDVGISTTTGASSTGLVYGENRVSEPLHSTANSGRTNSAVTNFRQVITSDTTYYGKAVAFGTNSSNLEYTCRLSARKIK